MIVSHRHRFIVLLPWKCASSTLRARLDAICESPYSTFYELNPHLKRVVHEHLTYGDFAALPEAGLGYYTAAFIRNPYDRVYSGFRQLQKDIEHQPTLPFADPRVKAVVMKQLAENLAYLRRSGFSFDAWVELIEDHFVFDVGRNTSFPLHPAHYWTHYNGEQAVDFIGRVERFEHDFGLLCEELKIGALAVVNRNVDSDVGEFAGDHRGYRYVDSMSSAARQRINRWFHDDFELFGYERVE